MIRATLLPRWLRGEIADLWLVILGRPVWEPGLNERLGGEKREGQMGCRVVGSLGVYPTASVIQVGIPPFESLVFGVRPLLYHSSGHFPEPWVDAFFLTLVKGGVHT